MRSAPKGGYGMCSASWHRVRREHEKMQAAHDALTRAQTRRNNLRVYGRGDLTKAQRKAVVAVEQAVKAVKAAAARAQRVERTYKKCTTRMGMR